MYLKSHCSIFVHQRPDDIHEIMVISYRSQTDLQKLGIPVCFFLNSWIIFKFVFFLQYFHKILQTMFYFKFVTIIKSNLIILIFFYRFAFVKWVRIDNSTSAKIIRNNTENGQYLIIVKRRQPRRGDTYNYKLVIRNTQATDSGVIKCRVNIKGSAVIERQFKVNAEDKLNINKISAFFFMYIYLHISINSAKQPE